MTDITPIVILVLTLISTIVTIVIAPWLRSKLPAEQWKTVEYWTDVAVYAAEQLFKGSGRGAEKLEYVINFLKSKGLYMDVEKIRVLIESKVAKLRGGANNEA